jgi:hypothetical protein
MTRAEELFRQICAGEAAEIERMVNDKVTEELFLDYKQSATPAGQRKLADDDRKNLAKTISGFGNGDGGVIIWGVSCRQSSGDIPDAPVPIADPVQFKALLDSAVGGLTIPPHTEVENRAFIRKGMNDGFVVTHVPPGLNLPVGTATQPPAYHIRAGSSVAHVTHGVLAAMFGKRPQSLVVGSFSPIVPENQVGTPRVVIRYDVLVENTGRGIADDVFVTVDPYEEKLVRILSWDANHDLWQKSFASAGPTVISKPNAVRLPPRARVSALTLTVGISLSQYENHSDLRLTGTCGSSTGPGSAFSREVSGQALYQIAQWLREDPMGEASAKQYRNEALQKM